MKNKTNTLDEITLTICTHFLGRKWARKLNPIKYDADYDTTRETISSALNDLCPPPEKNRTDHRRCAQEAANLQQKIDRLTVSDKNWQDQIANLTADSDAKIQNLRKEIADLQTENRRLSEARQQSDALLTNYRSQIATHKRTSEDLTALREEYAAARNLIDELKKQLAQKPEKRNRDDLRQIRTLEQSNAELTQSLSDSHQQLTQLITDSDNRIRKLISEINSQQQIIATLKHTNTDDSQT